MTTIIGPTMTKGPRIAIFPGTFDPITNGHLDVINRGKDIFDRLVVAIGNNPTKKALFSIEERVEITNAIIAESCPGVTVETYKGLTVNYARSIGATVILRGLRNVTDLHYEFQLALTNRAVADIETVFVMSGENYGFTSSSLIKQIAAGGEIDRLHRLLPALVVQRLKEKKVAAGGKLTGLFRDDFTE